MAPQYTAQFKLGSKSWGYSGSLRTIARSAMQEVSGWHGYIPDRVTVTLNGVIIIDANADNFEEALVAYEDSLTEEPA